MSGLGAAVDAASAAKGGVRILFISANPPDTARIAIGEEYREIDTRVRASACRDRINLIYAPEVRAGELARVLMRHQPAVGRARPSTRTTGHGVRSRRRGGPGDAARRVVPARLRRPSAPLP